MSKKLCKSPQWKLLSVFGTIDCQWCSLVKSNASHQNIGMLRHLDREGKHGGQGVEDKSGDEGWVEQDDVEPYSNSNQMIKKMRRAIEIAAEYNTQLLEERKQRGPVYFEPHTRSTQHIDRFIFVPMSAEHRRILQHLEHPPAQNIEPFFASETYSSKPATPAYVDNERIASTLIDDAFFFQAVGFTSNSPKEEIFSGLRIHRIH